MTPATLPQKLWRPLAEVKNYIEKMPDGVKLLDVSRKVENFGKLSAKEKKQLVDFLGERESIIVLKIKKAGGQNGMTLLRHKKYGYPKSDDDNQIVKNLDFKICSKCKKEKPRSEFYVNNSMPDGNQSYCKECVKASTHERSWKKDENYAKRITTQPVTEEVTMSTEQNNSVSPESLRKQAEELLKAAEIAEKKRQENDLFNKTLNPLKLELSQAAGKMQRKLDEFIDCMDEMNKAIQKLKELSAQ
ncbi:TPA: hypothetical protein I9Y23_004912 [Kluyvera ascorbata]|uniref:Uncharacterized protein n=1 Tax=Kluyvera genomosp. 2 TaxID=2774054 RepID=A0A2T2XUS4_9ENTR|nr:MULTISPECIES: hypothetical protein [Enterobacteriaceae]HAT3921188.1 hypothetical protein [Kluyvera ascorbata]ANZ87772.1 hypothetical protein CfB38_2856 [Citrobacter freundii]ANZ87843.1 hypothetical protein CfB38_2928 [Citrobacter freundii]PSR44073.1 hypothetical protein C8256_25220 [Kluyvera genomosp. 2]HAT3946123.1 hypothetical protein [Kluyvera ascorbata]